MFMVNLSVVSTVYKSEKYLPDFIDKVISTLEKIGEEKFEIIFVIDGITDNSIAYLLERKKSVPQIKIVELSRNFGHHYAITAGLNVSCGESVFITDCDMEVMPDILILFKKEMDSDKNLDVVYGFQTNRKGNIIERKFGSIFWRLFNLLSDVDVPANVVTERLMKRKYLDALINMGDKNLFLGGMMYWVGFNQKGIEITKKQREGKSSYSFRKRINLLFEAITSFSEKPLKLIFYLGCIISAISFSIAIFLLVKKIIYPDLILMGYASTLVIITFLFGILTLSIGITGLYIARIFKQVQNRPLYVIKSITK